MASRSKSASDIATGWLRGYAETYLPADAMFDFCADDLRRENVTLVDIKCLFRKGDVTFTDKLDAWGAIWMVVGPDVDGNTLVAEIHVHTDTNMVKLQSVERLNHHEEPPAA